MTELSISMSQYRQKFGVPSKQRHLCHIDCFEILIDDTCVPCNLAVRRIITVLRRQSKNNVARKESAYL